MTLTLLNVFGKGCYPKTPPQTDGQVIWPEIDDCVARVQRALDNLEPSFNDFARRLPDVPSEEIRFCWKAHLVADFGFSFCGRRHTGTRRSIITGRSEAKPLPFGVKCAVT